MQLLPLPTGPDAAQVRFKVQIGLSRVPTRSNGRTFVKRHPAVDIIGPGGFVLRTLRFAEADTVTRDNVLSIPRVKTALGELGVQPSAVEII